MKHKIPKAQQDVWEWKEKAYKTVSHLPSIEEQFILIHQRTKEAIDQLADRKRQKH